MDLDRLGAVRIDCVCGNLGGYACSSGLGCMAYIHSMVVAVAVAVVIVVVVVPLQVGVE